ncbi:hypothetical protein BGX28_004616 [Mortierella sp. GBA30]|nr:hypothetical protein BGX28_004616 [Mortierella sp. GBA30]
MLMKDYIHEVHADSLPATPTNPAIADDTSAPLSCPETNSGRDAFAEAIVSSATTKKPWEPLLYAKDVTCPEPWRENLMDEGALPPFLAYKRENDLNTLNKHAAENLMIYIGQAGTWTPAHIDQCGAIGHNIMVWSDNDSSSIWYMVKAEDRNKAEALWKSFGHPLEYESYFASVDELAHADFPIYVVEQKIGDFVMVPSQSYHQVINLGKATIKVSWNRLTSTCLRTAIECVLPRIGRPEGYRIKMITESALKAWTALLCSQTTELPMPPEQFCRSFRTVLGLFRDIVEEEWVDLSILRQHCATFIKPRRLNNVSPASCDFCSSDIWNRQMYCTLCTLDGDNYDLCTRCFALGRGCKHRALSMEFVEQFSMSSLRRVHAEAIDAWNSSRVLAGLEDYAQMTNGWTDEIAPTGKGYSYASLAYKRQMILKNPRLACHRCLRHDSNFVTAECSKCWDAYCETCLFEHHDLLWKDIEKVRAGWECLKCTRGCHCPSCDRKAGIEHKTKSKPVREEAMWFTRPEEDERNRAGISDLIDMDRSFENDEDDGNEGESDDEDKVEKCLKSAEGGVDVGEAYCSIPSIKSISACTAGPSSNHIKQGTRIKYKNRNKDELMTEVGAVQRNDDRDTDESRSLHLNDSSLVGSVKSSKQPLAAPEDESQSKQKSKKTLEVQGSSVQSPKLRPQETHQARHHKPLPTGSEDGVRFKSPKSKKNHDEGSSALDTSKIYHETDSGKKRNQSPGPEDDRRPKQQKSKNVQDRRSSADGTMRSRLIVSLKRQSPGPEDELRRPTGQRPRLQDQRPTLDDPKRSLLETDRRKRRQSPAHEEEYRSKQLKMKKQKRKLPVDIMEEVHPTERSLTREEFDMAMAPAAEAALRLSAKMGTGRAMEELQNKFGNYYKDLFRADRFFSALDAEVHQKFRIDAIELEAPKK